jgi:hypothetical protein
VLAYFSSGSEFVHEHEFKNVLEVLEGPSRWRDYIRPNLAIARAKISSKTFKIVSRGKFDEVLAGLGNPVPDAAGVTNKLAGEITMKEWGDDSSKTYLLAALHECVHWVSHPAEQGKPHSTAFATLGSGLLEGVVECVTEDILNAQGLTLPSDRSGMRGYTEGIAAIAREFLDHSSVPFYARALFQGNGDQLTAVYNFIYSEVGWKLIRNVISAGRLQDARQLMTRFRSQEENKRNKALITTQQQIRTRLQQQQIVAKALFDIIIHLP